MNTKWEWHHVARSDSLEMIQEDIGKDAVSVVVETTAHWTWQYNGLLPKDKYRVAWPEPMRQAACPVGGRTRKEGLPKTDGAKRIDREKQLESRACGSFCVLCLTGKAGPGTLGRATTEAEANQHWLSILLCSTGGSIFQETQVWFSVLSCKVKNEDLKPWNSLFVTFPSFFLYTNPNELTGFSVKSSHWHY